MLVSDGVPRSACCALTASLCRLLASSMPRPVRAVLRSTSTGAVRPAPLAPMPWPGLYPIFASNWKPLCHQACLVSCRGAHQWRRYQRSVLSLLWDGIQPSLAVSPRKTAQISRCKELTCSPQAEAQQAQRRGVRPCFAWQLWRCGLWRAPHPPRRLLLPSTGSSADPALHRGPQRRSS